MAAERPSSHELRRVYQQHGSVTRVAKAYGVAFETARRWLTEGGIEMRRKGRPSAAAEALSVRELKRRYANGSSIAELGTHFGVSPATVRARLIEAGVELRPRPGWKY